MLLRQMEQTPGLENLLLISWIKYNPDDYEAVTDMADVWFDSGSTHSFVLEERDDLFWPASLYLEGTDQHRGGSLFFTRKLWHKRPCSI